MTLGLREQKKQETREAIVDAAMRLFVERGFEGVTVADVAEAARVSVKTVFNYFATKEDLFFDEADARRDALVACVREREVGESLLAAVRRSAVANCSRLSSREFASFARVIEESPALQNKERAMFVGFSRAAAAELIAEGVPEAQASVACAAIAGVYARLFATARQRALAGWSGPEAEEQLRVEVQEGFALLERGLGSFAPKAAG